MLSAAQDYRAGYGGDQQHIWQATLSPEAICFTTHPGSEEDTSAGYWVGSGSLPRVAQVENVLVAVYRISRKPGIYLTNRLLFTHAWFPQGHFDEVVEKNGWILGRKGDGYIALYSQNGYHWQTEGEDADREVIAPGSRNIWICEMGRKASDGEFAQFVEKICGASLTFRGQTVSYHSPSRGVIEFGWRGPLKRNGAPVKMDGYPRYENPYSRAAFPPEEVNIEHNGSWLKLDLKRGIRERDEDI